jgi:protocatechuate 3,4-dioxygenase beta subunit
MTTTKTNEHDGPTRREFALGALGGLAATALLASCADDLGAGNAAAELAAEDGNAEAIAESSDAVGTCTAYPRQMEGPFYLDLDLVRRDITEGKPGAPLQIIVEVLRRSNGCSPISGAAVDLWHCDAKGWYSGYPEQGDNHNVDTSGKKFLRGTQITGADTALGPGKARFDTIYPGYYRGRTTHTHFKVHLPGGFQITTSQMYFPEDVTAAIYDTGAYAARGQKDTSNNADGIFRRNRPPLVAITQQGSIYVATLTITVA